MRRLVLLLLFSAAITAAASASAGSGSAAHRTSCRHVLRFKGHWYDALPNSGGSKPGRLLRHRARVACGSFVRCKTECVSIPERLIGSISVRRVRGVGREAKRALIDARTGRVYLRREPQGRAGGTVPPPAGVVTRTGDVPLRTGSYCWSAGSATGCADTVSPSAMPGLPLLVARRGAVIYLSLAFVPTKASVRLGRVVWSLTPARTLTWKVPAHGRGRFLQVDAERGSDHVEYLSRFQLR